MVQIWGRTFSHKKRCSDWFCLHKKNKSISGAKGGAFMQVSLSLKRKHKVQLALILELLGSERGKVSLSVHHAANVT